MRSTWYAEDDDLWTHLTLREAVDDREVAIPGAVVHLYVSTTGPWGELVGVCCGWLGTADAEPVLLDVDGLPFDPEDDPTTTEVEYRPSDDIRNEAR
jgi:hypothetical protein